MEKYRVNEIFYSLQGEGRWAGRAAVFIRFSGCNLRCPFCDTDFSAYTEMTIEEINKGISTILPQTLDEGSLPMIVLTGGEPTLQANDALIHALHEKGFYISMETNGTHGYPEGVDWVTLSPKDQFVKSNSQVVIKEVSELKIVFDSEHEIYAYPEIKVKYRYLQPCDTGDEVRNKEILRDCISYIQSHPQWQLSLQQHKIINIK